MCLYFQYVSLLRPPVTENSASGAEVIDKVEWKQVSHSWSIIHISVWGFNRFRRWLLATLRTFISYVWNRWSIRASPVMVYSWLDRWTEVTWFLFMNIASVNQNCFNVNCFGCMSYANTAIFGIVYCTEELLASGMMHVFVFRCNFECPVVISYVFSLMLSEY